MPVFLTKYLVSSGKYTEENNTFNDLCFSEFFKMKYLHDPNSIVANFLNNILC